MLVEVRTEVEPDPKSLNWLSHKEATNTIPGGRTHIGDSKFIDSEGRSLDPETQITEIDDEMQRLETRKKQLEDLKAKTQGEVKTKVDAPPAKVEPTVVVDSSMFPDTKK